MTRKADADLLRIRAERDDGVEIRDGLRAEIREKTRESANSFEAGKKAAFIEAVEECQAFVEGLRALWRQMEIDGAPSAFTIQIEDKMSAAQQIAMRIAQRAKRP